jgi:hypothetical protein
MRLSSTLLAMLALAGSAAAGLNRSYLVPVYEACPGSGNCFPPKRASSYTFDSAVLYSSPKPYTGPGKLALVLAVKGLRDAAGNLVTGTLELRVTRPRVTLLTQGVGTLGETSPFVPDTVYSLPVTNGSGRRRFNTPADTPTEGFVANTFAAPVLYDPEGKELASTGTQSKP